MSPDLDSINVETFVINNNYKIDTSSSNISSPGQSVGHTATIIDNFNNTGRTMLVVKVKLPDENNNMQYFQKSINLHGFLFSK